MPTSLRVRAEEKARIRILTKCLKYSGLVEWQAACKKYGSVGTDFAGLMRMNLKLFPAV